MKKLLIDRDVLDDHETAGLLLGDRVHEQGRIPVAQPVEKNGKIRDGDHGRPVVMHDANRNVGRPGLSPDKLEKIYRKQHRGKLEKVDRKQNRMEEEYGIKVSQYTVEAEEHIADDRENTQRHDGAHAEAGKDGKSCGVSDNIDI